MTASRRTTTARLLLVLAVVAILVVGTVSGVGGSAVRGLRTPSPPPVDLRGAPVTSPVQPAIHIVFPHPTWINVTNDSPGNAPPAVQEAISVYDPNDHETVLFGGVTTSGAYQNQTWLFSNGVWTNDTDPAAAPPARTLAAADFDPNMGGVLLFGGYAPTGELNDTWLFADGGWTNLTADYGFGPSPRYGAAMAFDPQSPENGSVLFGGYGPPSGYDNDTWIWQGGAGWVPLTTNSIAPPTLFSPSMAYDATDGYIVLVGGDDAGTMSSATWELYAGQWWAVQTTYSPPAEAYTDLLYVPDLAGVLFFGGYSYATDTDNWQTWLFSGGQWAAQAPSAHPQARSSSGFALDGTGTTALITGGANDSTSVFLNDTWAYEFAPGVTIAVNNSGPEVGTSVAVTASPDDGTGPYRAVFDFGDGSYAVASGPGDLTVNHTFQQNATFDLSVSITDAVGATADSGPIAVTVAAPPTVSADATPNPADVGHSISFASTLNSSARAGASYNWSFGDGSFAGTANATHAYAAAGIFTVVLNATDSDGSTATAVLSVTIVPDPSLAVAATSTHPAAGALTTFFANVTGGTGPYAYSWLFGDGSAASTVPSPDHAFGGSGTYTVQAWANDSDGASTHQTLTVTVGNGAASAPGSSLGGVPLWFWAGIGALAVVLVVGGLLLARRGRGA